MEMMSDPDRMTVNGMPVSLEPDTAVPVTRLAVSDALFASTGVARVKTTRRGKPVVLDIPIKSVDLDAVQQRVKHLRPRAPARREQIQGQWTTVQDPHNPEYLEKLDRYNTALGQVWVLMAIDVDLVDGNDEVVWSADNSIAFFEQASLALKAMGLVSNQLTTLLHAVRTLTEMAEEELEGN